MPSHDPEMPFPVIPVDFEDAGEGSRDARLSALRVLSTGVLIQGAGGEITFCNPAAERILGLGRDRLAGRNLVDAGWRAIQEDGTPFPGEAHPSVVSLRTGKAVRGVLMGIHRPDGTLRWISLDAEPIPGSGGLPDSVVSSFVDVTDRLRAEARYRSLFREMLNGFALHEIICDGQGAPVDYLFLAVNPAFERMTGLKEEQIVGRTVLGVLPGIERRWIETYGKVALTGEPIHFQSYAADLKKHFEVTAYSPSPGQFACIFADVTERLALEDEGRANRQILRQVLDSVPQGIFWKDCESTYLGCNEAFARRAGLTDPGQVVGKTDFDLPWPREEAEAYRADDEAVLRSGIPKIHIEEQLQQADGTRLWIDTTKVPLLDPQGGVRGVLGVFGDISERRRMEEALRTNERKFREIFDNNPEPIAITRNEDGGYVAINPAFTRVFGYRPEEVLGRTSIELGIWVDPEDRNRLIEGGRSEDRVENLELRFRCKDGRVRTTLVSSSSTEIGGAHHRLSIVRDITERKHAEDALREGEALFRAVIDSSPVPMALNDARLNIKLLNPAFVRTFGFTPEDIPTVTDWWPKAYPDQEYRRRVVDEWQERLGRSVRGGTPFEPMEVVIRTAHGTDRTVLVSASPLVHGPGGDLLVVLYDITERRNAEEALRESRDEISLLLQSTDQGIYGLDTQGRCTLINRSALTMLGFSLEECLGREMHGLIHHSHPDGSAYAAERCPVLITQRTGTGCRVDGDVLWRKDGSSFAAEYSSFPVLKEGRIQGTVVAFSDITERRRSEEKRRILQEDLAATLAALPDLMFDVDREGRFYDFRAPDPALLAAEPEEFLGKLVRDVLPPHAARVVTDSLAEAVRTGSYAGSSFPLTMPNGERWFELSIAAKEGPEGKRERFIVLSRDITERRQAQEEIRLLNADLERRVAERTAQLEESNRELEAFSYSVSHDLRAPLRAIEGFSGMLVKDGEERLNAEDRRRLEIVRTNARRMSTLIDDLLAFSRTGRHQLRHERLVMKSFARSSFEEVSRGFENPGRFEFRLGELPDAVGDPPLVRQVWVNLVSNALKFSSRREAPVIEVGSTADGESVAYWVRDNGVGFDAKYAEKLFGVFQRLHGITEFEGTGIGLALVKRIVERHGGRVWAVGEPGRGATFSFTLGPAPSGDETTRDSALFRAR